MDFMPRRRSRERTQGSCTVPRVLGLSPNTARDRCLADGLLLDVEGPVPPPPVAVVAQRPPSGTAARQWSEVSVLLATKRPRWYPRPLRWFGERVAGAVLHLLDGLTGGM